MLGLIEVYWISLVGFGMLNESIDIEQLENCYFLS